MEMEIFFPGGKRVDANVRDFIIQTDQKKERGGEDEAPTPFELFLASLGTCAGIYVLSFCQSHNIPTEGIRLRQRVERNPATGMLDRIELEILLPADFPAKYQTAVIRSAEKCTVKKHLEQPPQFSIITRQEVPVS
ncbi:MAG: OsmC family protein [Acidobacteria bacterium]|nr:OsmC family protein [Acidobacteriota bacterium]